MVWLTLMVLVLLRVRTPVVRPGPATRFIVAIGTLVPVPIRLENGIRQPGPIGTDIFDTTLLADMLTILMLRLPSIPDSVTARLKL